MVVGLGGGGVGGVRTTVCKELSFRFASGGLSVWVSQAPIVSGGRPWACSSSSLLLLLLLLPLLLIPEPPGLMFYSAL